MVIDVLVMAIVSISYSAVWSTPGVALGTVISFNDVVAKLEVFSPTALKPGAIIFFVVHLLKGATR